MVTLKRQQQQQQLRAGNRRKSSGGLHPAIRAKVRWDRQRVLERVPRSFMEYSVSRSIFGDGR
jgi:hypothetical protein